MEWFPRAYNTVLPFIGHHRLLRANQDDRRLIQSGTDLVLITRLQGSYGYSLPTGNQKRHPDANPRPAHTRKRMPTKPLPAADLAHILTHARASFLTLRGTRLFITGGTGFFGHWLLESLLHANNELALNLHATVLTRSAAAFRAKSPHIADHPAITLLEGDIRTFAFPAEPHTHILHAATDSGGQQSSRTPAELHDDILAGTRHVLDFAHHTAARRLLYTSTGAVYGRSTTLLHTPETFLETDHPLLPPHSYESAKRAAELLCLDRATHSPLEPELDFPFEVILARCFAFVGPHLPLDAHFAIGNFLGAALANRPIHIRGDGTPRRSWLYMADLAIWLWALLTHGQPSRAYNVGSDDGMTIATAAHLTAATLRPNLPIQIDATPAPTAPLNSYVPSITRARTELNLQVTIPLAEALRRTAAWRTALTNP
jgi:UDP-glucuronate decarboxylase